MRPRTLSAMLVFCSVFAGFAKAQTPVAASGLAMVPDPVKTLVERLDLEQYKANIKGLTQYGDRRQGTERNRAAIDWIEAQLKRYGCVNTERIKYTFTPPPGRGGRGGANAASEAAVTGAPAPGTAADGRPPGRGGGRGGRGGAQGGAKARGVRARIGVNNDPNAQPDAKLRELNTPPSVPGPREEVYCTKVGATHPEEMYIVAAHMDGIGYGEAANDDGSGTALVMEIARIFSQSGCGRRSGPSALCCGITKRPAYGAPRLRGAAQGSAGQGRSRRARENIRSRNGWA